MTGKTYCWPTQYQVTAMPQGGPSDSRRWSLFVHQHRGGTWFVSCGTMCLNSKGGWDPQLPFDEQDSQWLGAHTFSKTRAIEAAKGLAPLLTVNGRTAQQAYDEFAVRVGLKMEADDDAVA